jgi:hypothetical protein
MRQALARHERKEACVIPIILRPTAWQGAPFSQLNMLPTKAVPITSGEWHHLDEAFLDVANNLRKMVIEWNQALLKREDSALFSTNSVQYAQDLKRPKRSHSPWIVAALVLLSLMLLGGGSVSVLTITGHWPWVVNTFSGASTGAPSLIGTRTHIPVTAQATSTACPKTVPSYPSYLPGCGILVAHDPKTSGVNWEQGSSNDGAVSCGFSHGAYHAKVKQTLYRKCYWTSWQSSDFVYEMRVTIVQGDCAGVFFRDNSRLYYVFAVCQGGEQDFYRYVLARDTIVLEGTGDGTAVKKGLNQSNLIIAVAQGKTLTMYVNSQKVAQEQDTTDVQGGLGVIAIDQNNPTDATFSDATLWKL